MPRNKASRQGEQLPLGTPHKTVTSTFAHQFKQNEAEKIRGVLKRRDSTFDRLNLPTADHKLLTLCD